MGAEKLKNNIPFSLGEIAKAILENKGVASTESSSYPAKLKSCGSSLTGGISGTEFRIAKVRLRSNEISIE
jgi:hypothetical protein